MNIDDVLTGRDGKPAHSLHLKHALAKYQAELQSTARAMADPMTPQELAIMQKRIYLEKAIITIQLELEQRGDWW